MNVIGIHLKVADELTWHVLVRGSLNCLVHRPLDFWPWMI